MAQCLPLVDSTLNLADSFVTLFSEFTVIIASFASDFLDLIRRAREYVHHLFFGHTDCFHIHLDTLLDEIVRCVKSVLDSFDLGGNPPLSAHKDFILSITALFDRKVFP